MVALHIRLHHIIPINQGGSVYSVDNLVVVTPRYHAEILIPEVHGYNGFKQFFR
ncbi:MAG: HNH endonuclease signature motif containing protein [Roseburia hominis]